MTPPLSPRTPKGQETTPFINKEYILRKTRKSIQVLKFQIPGLEEYICWPVAHFKVQLPWSFFNVTPFMKPK